jgi:PAS domain S-box-containing protein
MPLRAKVTIAASFAAGVLFTAVCLMELRHSPAPTASTLAVFSILSILVGVTRLWPVLVYHDNESEAVTLDETLLVMAVLLLPWAYALSCFVVSTAAVQAILRRTLSKAMFNWGQAVVSAGLGVMVSRLVAGVGPDQRVIHVVGAALAAVAFFTANNIWMAAIVSALGASWSAAIRDELNNGVWLLVASVAIGTMLGLAISDQTWTIVVAIVTLVILRQLVAGHFQARHDRFRLLGLFRVALAANVSLQEDDVVAPLLESTRALLKSSASVATTPPATDEIGAKMPVNGQQLWLNISRRARNEPFDAADVQLLEALGAVGSVALRNAALYQEIRTHEERLSAITGSLGEGVCALDHAGRLTFLNPAARRMLGWTNEEGDPVTPAFLRRPAEEVMRSARLVRAEEAAFRRSDGVALPVELTASALVEHDRPVGAVIVFRDISERRELHARLHASQKLEALGRLAGGVAHDFNNVLAVIALCSDLLSATAEGRAVEFIAEIRGATARAAALTDQLLTFSRSQRVAAGSVEPVDVILGVQQMLNRLIGAHIQVTTDVEAASGSVVQIERGRLEQVIMNLVLNARDAMPDGGTLRIEAARVELGANQVSGLPAGPYVRIIVSDTGIGMTPETQAHLFEPFFTTKARGEGTGLGLATVVGIVSRIGGHLSVESRLGLGSTFSILLPTAASAADSTGDGPSPDPIAEAAAGGTLLFVDDEPAVRSAAALILEGAGYRVLQASDGVEALEVATRQHSRIDMVITDVLMPKLTGPALVERLESLGGAVKVLFISGYSEDVHSEGFDEDWPLLAKPFGAASLLAAVRAVLDGSPASVIQAAVDNRRP